MKWWACSLAYSCSLLRLQMQVAKLVSGLFDRYSLLRNNNMATNLQRFSYGRRRFSACDCWTHGRRKDFFQGVGPRGEICFLSLEIEKTMFFANNFKIQGGPRPPCPPSDAHGWTQTSLAENAARQWLLIVASFVVLYCAVWKEALLRQRSAIFATAAVAAGA